MLHPVGLLNSGAPSDADLFLRAGRPFTRPHTRDRYRIAVIAPSRSPIAQPFTGGLEAHLWTLVQALRERGHEVTLYAAPGSDPVLQAEELDVDTHWLSGDARRDVSMPADIVISEHHAYLELMLHLTRSRQDFDVVLNHSLHYLPVAMAELLQIPMLTTLHTPPTPWLESAMRAARQPRDSHLVAVSAHTARAWEPAATARIAVVSNGVDCAAWRFGVGGGPLVWSGRIVPEKGVHLAITAARLAGCSIDIAGPVVDRRYFTDHVLPLLDAKVRYLGHLDQPSLSELVRNADVALVTPDWDEPYGLVVAEALASGTPVAAFARGGIPEIVDSGCARLVPPGDVHALAAAIAPARQLDRRAIRRWAETHCSIGAMLDGYEGLLHGLLSAPAA